METAKPLRVGDLNAKQKQALKDFLGCMLRSKAEVTKLTILSLQENAPSDEVKK